MATLNVRQLNDFIYEQLHIRVAEHTVSIAEVRQILTKLSIPERLS